MHAYEVMCTDVLSDEARECNAERKEGVVEEALDARVDGHTCHRCIAKRVDVGLDDEGRDAHKDRLQSRRNARAENGEEVGGLKEGTMQTQLPYTVEMAEFSQGKQC